MRRAAAIVALAAVALIVGAGAAMAAFTALRSTPQTFTAAENWRPTEDEFSVASKSNDGGVSASQMQFGLKVHNIGETRINLDYVTLRYWFTSDGTGPPHVECYWTTIGCHKLKFDFVHLTNPRDEADYYLEVGFFNASLIPGSTAELNQLAIRNFEGTNYDQQSDDHSFLNVGSFTDNVKVTAYNRGELVWGVEPELLPVVEAVSVDYANGDQDPQNTVMKPQLRVIDTGNVQIELSEVTLRYWFSRDTQSPIQAYCDYAQTGCHDVNLSVHAVTGRVGVDAYLQVGFDPGPLEVDDSSGPIHIRLQRSDWQRLDEANDYSWNTNPAFEPTTTVTAYLRGKLVWGAEP